MKYLMMFIVMILGLPVFSQNAVELIRKLDSNRVFKSITYEGEMIIKISTKEYTKTFNAFSKGNTDNLIIFTNQDDIGIKYLRKKGNLYVYSPDLEKIMPITGHMLRESMMGSDLSYEDTLNNDTLESQYNVTILEETKFEGPTKFNGRPVWVLELLAINQTVSYPKQIIWLDKETYAALKVEQFALSQAKLKEILLLDAEWIGDRYFETETQVKDLLRKDSTTILKMNKVDLNTEISKNKFSLRQLER